MTHIEFEEKRYCVEAFFVNEGDNTLTTFRHFFDNFFDAVERAKEYTNPNVGVNDVELFDNAAGRILFDLADLD